MKKIFILLLIIGCLTGCSRIDKEVEYKNIAYQVMSSSNNIVNKATTGYKYYLPKGVNLVYNLDFNQKFRVLDEDLYLYVDIVSYHYKNQLNDKETDFNYYYSFISSSDKVGFLGINKEDDKYFVKIVYNYAKIEFYTNKNKLSNLIGYSMLIVDSIEYNDSLIEKMLEDNEIKTKESSYSILKPNDNESKFSQYLQEYVIDEEKIEALPDE